MSDLLWNCRGAASGRLAHTLKVLVQKHNIKLVAIFEPRASGDRAAKLAKSLGFDKIIVEEAQGFSGGICYLCQPREEKRNLLWQDLRRMSSQVADPWITNGDFNEIAHSSEKKGGATVDITKCQKFADVLDDSWRLKYTYANVRVLPRIQSDHNPLLVELYANQAHLRTRPFRFVAAWQQHPMFNSFLDEYWQSNETCRKQATRRVIQYSRTRRVVVVPKVKGKWIVDGDRNTKFYHLKTIIHMNTNKILRLKNDNQTWISDPSALQELARNFYLKLFKEEDSNRKWIATEDWWPIITQDTLQDLKKPPSMKDIRHAIFDMVSFKAPGVDGFQAIFFQQNWDRIKDQVCQEICYLWQNPADIKRINSTLLVLIPKVAAPTLMSHMRPISLCSVLYKVLSKIVVIKLKPIMERIISPCQASFIPKRHIQDNIIVAQELVHTMHRMRGRKGFMAIKVDLEKAYDRLSWGILKEVLSEIKLPGNFLNIVMAVVTTSNISFLWNGELTPEFQPSRGVRQGDPISPFLFVLGIEKLSHMIANVVGKGEWNPIRRLVKHKWVCVIVHILNEFALMSCLRVSLAKTSIYFSKNVDDIKADKIASLSGFKRTRNLGRYLGAMMQHGRVSKALFNDLVDKVKSKCKVGKLNAYLWQVQCQFIWNGFDQNRGNALIEWSTLVQPKQKGGLGVKCLDVMNDAFLEIVTGFLPPAVNDGLDVERWSIGGHGSITVKDAYQVLLQKRVPLINHSIPDHVWNALWHWKGPERVKIFMWKCLHRRLPTRAWAAKWSDANPVCSRCLSAYETDFHVLRDCVVTKTVWDKMLSTRRQASFYDLDWVDWMSSNICNDRSGPNSLNWDTIFLLTCRELWNDRNAVYHGKEGSADFLLVRKVQCMALDIKQAFGDKGNKKKAGILSKIHIAWQPPDYRWIKLNTDGAAKGSPGVAACGGLCRGSDGQWLGGFAYHVGIVSAFTAELWGILKGLEFTWNKGFRKIIIESDSTSVITLFTSKGNDVRESHIVTRIRIWMNKDWDLKAQHIHREGYQCADWLANHLICLPTI
ncbi:uncharacterized protein LOC133299869 [Gastrolobium bilobum]|uniref:uncharacterized protein LOC133299869 n=1 Tax=Gastrolobium bilobum TaxID=150636 RepID=UPI002AB25A42|nr:uncharacterized protein LOC133299869 [Gastrolobium bilobum]